MTRVNSAQPSSAPQAVDPIPPGRQTYPSEEAAAYAAMADVHGKQLETGLEHGTIIYKTDDGRYYYDPLTTGQETGTGQEVAPLAYHDRSGHTPVAQTHSHPDGAIRNDPDGDNKLKVPMYVVEEDGTPLKYEPKSHKAKELDKEKLEAAKETEKTGGSGKGTETQGTQNTPSHTQRDGVDPPPDDPHGIQSRVDASQDTKISEEDENFIDPKGTSDATDSSMEFWA